MKRMAVAALLALTLLALLALFSVRTGQVGALQVPAYDLSWWTVDGGGTTSSTGGPYHLAGTAGQPDAGLLGGKDYRLGGGFWTGGALRIPFSIYLPMVTRDLP